MPKSQATPPAPRRESDARLWLAYASTCLLAWLLFILAGTEFQRGLWQLWEAAYEATLTLWVPMLLGLAGLPWARFLVRRDWPVWIVLPVHVLAATLFGTAWLALDFGAAWSLFGAEHAQATLNQSILWRVIWGLLVYAALATGFMAALNARRARALTLAAAQAESALARAELAAISGKLNPHFLFNTLNSLIALTRKDARAAEQGLLRFAGMLRYVLATKRDTADRVALQDELDFVRDYLALESLRLGARLRVEWDLDAATLEDEIPPLSLQPLVENSIVHGIAPQLQGGLIRIAAQRDAMTAGLNLTVSDDGAGCDPALLEADSPRRSAGGGSGIGLGALRRRFALDYEGRARLRVHTAPGAGFRVDIWIPQT